MPACRLVLLAWLTFATRASSSQDMESCGDEPGSAVSLIQVQSKVSRDEVLEHLGNVPHPNNPLEPECDSSLQAPAEGGRFSEFFNARRKGNGIHKWLQYFPAYQRHLGKFIGKEVHIVEIGIQSGGSMEMWKGVFGAGAHVYGCDINPACKSYEDNQTKIFIGDQENPTFWAEFISKVPRIDILIDDGGHTVEQQIATLGIMLPKISPDGVYITEDLQTSGNPFWKNLRFETLSSPKGKRYTGLGSFVSSVHIYPYLLVIERGETTESDMPRQLGADDGEGFRHIRTAAVETSVLTGPSMKALQQVFPHLSWDKETKLDADMPLQLEEMAPHGLLFVRDSSEFSFDAPWDAQADAFMSSTISQFRELHHGICCDVHASTMQQKVDSLHFYPQLLIAQRFGRERRLIKAPRHGTHWIPY